MDGDRTAPPRLVVVGGVSVDRISTPHQRAVQVLGGGGLYAALAAATRTSVGLVGICSDHPLTAGRPWRAWVDDAGLVTLPGRGLWFDISYDAAGQASYRTDAATDEQHLHPGQLPSAFRHAAGFHVCALGDPATQLRYAMGLRSNSETSRGRLSAGTFLARIVADRNAVRQLLGVCSLFLCSATEALELAGVPNLDAGLRWLARSTVSPDQAIVVTDAAAGCLIVNAATVQRVRTYPSQVVDPTGAGEAFAGAYTACLVEGDGHLTAARYACAIASLVVEEFGPAALLHLDPQVLAERVDALADVIAEVGS